MHHSREPSLRPLTPEEQIARNRVLTCVLLIVFVVHAGIFVVLVGWLSESWLAAAALLAFFALFVAGAAAWFDVVLLRGVHARRLAKGEYPELEAAAVRLSRKLSIPRPALHIIDNDRSLNAFTCGRRPDHAAVVMTTGNLRALTPPELEGVVAHELSHIVNGDMRVGMWSYALLGWVSLISWAAYSTIDALDALSSRLAEATQSLQGLLGLMTLVATLFVKGLLVMGWVAVFLWSFIARLVDLAISRRREYLADASGAKLTGNPLALASALEKAAEFGALESGGALVDKLCIVRPESARRRWWEDLLSTHPSIEARIDVLRRMAHVQRSAR